MITFVKVDIKKRRKENMIFPKRHSNLFPGHWKVILLVTVVNSNDKSPFSTHNTIETLQ